MADTPNDITTEITASEDDVADLKKTHYKEAGAQTRMATPARISEQPHGLNIELLNMLKIGKRFATFQGVDRCIRVLDPNTPNARHCGAMMVKNLTTNMQMCSNCDKIKDPNAQPRIINSSMIRLSNKELEECGLKEDPLINAKPEPAPKKSRKNPAKMAESVQRSRKVPIPNSVKIEMTMKDLNQDSNVVGNILNKVLEAIFELPVKNFREAEEIRVVKERIEALLKESYHA